MRGVPAAGAFRTKVRPEAAMRGMPAAGARRARRNSRGKKT